MGTAAWHEILWTLMGLLWAGMTAWGTWTAWGDYRYARRHPDGDPLVQAELIGIARGYLRYEASSVFGGLLITLVGVRALTLPDNPAATDLGAALVGLGFVLYALIKTVVSVQNRLARRHFNRLLQQSARAKEHPHV